MTAGRMTYDWEEAHLPEGDLLFYADAHALTRRLTNRLGLTVKITDDTDPDEAAHGIRSEGYYDPNDRIIGYPGCQGQGMIPEATVLHEVAHAWRDQHHGWVEEPHDPIFLGLLISLHRDHHPDGWWDDEGSEILQSASDEGCLPPFVYTRLPARRAA